MSLPAYPWLSRPDSHPLTAEEVCDALVEADGNIRAAAALLHVGSLVLRKFIDRSPRARAVLKELDLCLADDARTHLREALRSESHLRSDQAARFILNSRNAAHLGWSSAADPDRSDRPAPITLVMPPMQWGDGQVLTPRETQRQVAGQIIDAAPAPNSTPAND